MPAAAIVRGALPVGVPRLPVVIVGAGACGLTAALALGRAGIECVVLERDASPAGSTALSSGFVPAPGTLAQQRQGISDSPERFAADILAKSAGQADRALVAAFTQAIGPALDALESHHGLVWQVLDDFLYPGHGVHRMHAVPEKTGQGLITRLCQAVEASGIPVLTDAQVLDLHVGEDDRVLGVIYRRPDGQREAVACDALLLACNGFGGNPDRVRQFIPEMAEAIYAGHAGNDGSAIAWGEALGAGLADLAAYQGHGAWAVPHAALISWALVMAGGVQINVRGERFHDETRGYSEAAVSVLEQPGGIAWLVFDDPVLLLARGFPDFVAAEQAGAVQAFADSASLARRIGCAVEVLERTLAAVATGVDALTGRTFQRALARPLHAVRVTGALFHTQGGLSIDAGCRVLRPDGTVFPNLLAAGGAARGVSGQAVWGYLSGNGLLSAIAGGHIAAATAASLV
jgi:fumarate reductase flavoprotein subunit